MARFLRVTGLFICVSGLGLVLLLATSRFYSPPAAYPVQAAVEIEIPSDHEIEFSGWRELTGSQIDQQSAITPSVTQAGALLFSVPEIDQNPIEETSASVNSTLNNEKTLSTSSQEQSNAITRLVIPELRLDAPVEYVPFTVFTWELDDLGQSIAWLGSMKGDGIARNLVLAGHATVFDGSHGPFRYLSRLTPGAELIVYSERYVYFYRVRELSLVEPEDADITENTADSQLTLVTCATWNEKTKSYLRRLVVIADLLKVEPIPQEIMD
jgi:LPXTG-site transpeptidase (sortase) family protein